MLRNLGKIFGLEEQCPELKKGDGRGRKFLSYYDLRVAAINSDNGLNRIFDRILVRKKVVQGHLIGFGGEPAPLDQLLHLDIVYNVVMRRFTGTFERFSVVMTRVTHSLCFLFWRKPIDLYRDHKRITVGFHSYETFVGILTETNEPVRKIVKIVVLP